MSNDDLTIKQRLFVEHYLSCFNASEAARRAGYSRDTAAVIGSENLRKPNIAAAIQEGFAKRAMPADEVLARLADIARSDARDLLEFDPEGNVIGLRLHEDAPLHLIKELTRSRYGLGVKVYDKQAALETLGRYHKLWTDKIEHSGNIDVTQLTDEQLRDIVKGESGD